MTTEEAIKLLLTKVQKQKNEEEKFKVVENFLLNFEHQRRLEKTIKESFLNSIFTPVSKFRTKHINKIKSQEQKDLITKKIQRSEKFRYLHNNLDLILDCIEKDFSLDKIATELIKTKRPAKKIQPSRQSIYNFLKTMQIPTSKKNLRNKKEKENTNDNKTDK
jgi:tRNA A37 threonylcarbamoyladenosine dehydratase